MHDQYQAFKEKHGLPVAFDRDVELVGKYIAYGEPVDSPTWKRLEDGGTVGASWLVHELTEVRALVERGVDIFDDQQLEPAYPSAHGHALIVEHRYLYDIARKKGL